MSVVVPYRPGMLFARTYDAAKAWEGGCEFVRVRNADETPAPDGYNPTYPELLADLWEQDVVPYEDALEARDPRPRDSCPFGVAGPYIRTPALWVWTLRRRSDINPSGRALEKGARSRSRREVERAQAPSSSIRHRTRRADVLDLQEARKSHPSA
jgi:hypothetical protein